ncbi:MAG TPA: hypothetical protein VLX91_15725 [Candidatus Acidoferrales bacterium]|nr:hypothetical protein [Candidatus Acidoferrales bacterium]
MYYEADPDPIQLWQGDVIRNFILPVPTEQVYIVRNPPDPLLPTTFSGGKNIPIKAIYEPSDLQDAFFLGKEALLTDALLTNVAIISHSCDIDRKPFLTVAAVKPITVVTNKNRRENLKDLYKVFEYFWLPLSDNLEESIVDFSVTYSVKAEVLRAKLNDRILSLTPEYRTKLRHKLQQYFGRPD